jgi:hypothetical protein
MLTPGGGGFGRAEDDGKGSDDRTEDDNCEPIERGSVFHYRMLQESA